MSGFLAALLICILAAGRPACKVETRVVDTQDQCRSSLQEIYMTIQSHYPKGTPIAIRGMCLPLPNGQKS